MEERPSFEKIVAMELFDVVSEKPHLINSGSVSPTVSEFEETNMLLSKSEDQLN